MGRKEPGGGKRDRGCCTLWFLVLRRKPESFPPRFEVAFARGRGLTGCRVLILRWVLLLRSRRRLGSGSRHGDSATAATVLLPGFAFWGSSWLATEL